MATPNQSYHAKICRRTQTMSQALLFSMTCVTSQQAVPLPVTLLDGADMRMVSGHCIISHMPHSGQLYEEGLYVNKVNFSTDYIRVAFTISEVSLFNTDCSQCCIYYSYEQCQEQTSRRLFGRTNEI